MSEFQLHCFAESGNCYKVALMLELTGRDWEPLPVQYFRGDTRTPAWRESINEMGEAPVLVHGNITLSQSGVILDYLSEITGQYGPESADERREILRWMLFDNHKFTSYYATLRFLFGLQNSGETPVVEFLRARAITAYAVVDKHLEARDFLVGNHPTIADLSLCGYTFFTEATGIDRQAQFPHIEAWVQRIGNLPGWKSPWDLMPKG